MLANVFSIGSTKKIRILIVPGHEPDYGGAEYKNVKERDLAVELGEDLKNLLETNPRYQVFITRDTTGWSPTFSDYFKNNWQDIISWERTSRRADIAQIATGHTTKPVSIVQHNSVPNSVAIHLYGITKWANENNIDLMIHVHLNDDAEHPTNATGKYSGFAIYVPVSQYTNSAVSHLIARDIFGHLLIENPISDLKQESGGIIDEPELIAIGAHNTSQAASMLIEYGYIYEPKFTNIATRSQTLYNLADETYLGIQDYYH